MKKKFCIFVLCASLLYPAAFVSADVLDYEEILDTYEKEDIVPQIFEIEDGSGKKVKAVAKTDTFYVTAKEAVIRSAPGENSQELDTVLLGEQLKRVAACDNGWSKVNYEQSKDNKIIGYVLDSVLSEEMQIQEVSDTVTVAVDTDILDYPGKKDGQVVGEVLELDEVKRTGTIHDIWSRIIYQDDSNTEQIGYIPTSSLEGQEKTETAKADSIDEKKGAGKIHKSDGKGVFAEAVDGISDIQGTISEVAGVKIGTPVAVSSDAALKPLGTFRITHYCPCSICCGPWADGITSTGVTAVTNHTIAVDPSQIPYGSQVVINGQVYVAEDCGGAIKTNCIDIYVATHEEGESKGVYYTDVYLIQ